MSIEVGTAETTVEKEIKRKRRPGLTGGGSGGGGRRRGGGGGGSGGDGGDNRNDERPWEETEYYQPNKLRITMWFLLVVVLMTFGGLISTYIVLATNRSYEWQPYLPVSIWVQVGISTLLILLSSVSMEIARRRLFNDDQSAAKKWLTATTVFGGMFIASQLAAWVQLVRFGVYVEKNPYAGLFYILTAVHALHVAGGICALGYIILHTWRETRVEEEILKRRTAATVVSWYWHTMDGLWLVLLFLLAFYK